MDMQSHALYKQILHTYADICKAHARHMQGICKHIIMLLHMQAYILYKQTYVHVCRHMPGICKYITYVSICSDLNGIC